MDEDLIVRGRLSLLLVIGGAALGLAYFWLDDSGFDNSRTSAGAPLVDGPVEPTLSTASADTTTDRSSLSGSDRSLDRIDKMIEQKAWRAELEGKITLRHDIPPGMQWVEGPPGEIATYVETSPDGKFDAFITMPEADRATFKRIFLHDLTTGEWTKIEGKAAQGSEILGLTWSHDGKSVLYLNRYADMPPADPPTDLHERGNFIKDQILKTRWSVCVYDVTVNESRELFVSPTLVYDFSGTDSGAVMVAARSTFDFNDATLYTLNGKEIADTKTFKLGDVARVLIEPVRRELWYEERVFAETEDKRPSVLLRVNVARMPFEGNGAGISERVVENASLCFFDRSESRFVYEDSSNAQWVFATETSAKERLFPGARLPNPVGFTADGTGILFYGHRQGFKPGAERLSGDSKGMGIFRMAL